MVLGLQVLYPESKACLLYTSAAQDRWTQADSHDKGGAAVKTAAPPLSVFFKKPANPAVSRAAWLQSGFCDPLPPAFSLFQDQDPWPL